MFAPLLPPAGPAPAFENPRKTGAPITRRRRQGEFGRGGGCASQRVGDQKEHRPTRRRRGNQPTMVRTDNPSRQVRHDQADKADHAARGNGRRGGDGDGDQQERCSRRTLTPKSAAARSPARETFIAGASAVSPSSVAVPIGKTSKTSRQPASHMPPISQKTSVCNRGRRNRGPRPSTPNKKAPTAIPARGANVQKVGRRAKPRRPP